MRQCWYFMPHGITADHPGNIWLTDVAMHQVFKIPPGQTVQKMTLGQKFQHGEDTNLFCKPTDVAVLMSGEFFVSDGYCNSRVLKFSKDGTFLMSFGKRNVQFGAGGLLYAVNGPAFDGPIDTTVQGFTSDINTGDLLEMWNVPDNMQNPHYVAADTVTHSIYVGELDPESVWKFSRPVTVQSSSQHNKGKFKCYGHGKKGKVFNLKGFTWNSHKGFDRLSTEESDHEVDPDDLDDKDYLTPPKTNKA
ncbi:peptidyl-glycine alpha-amidating monooxygenase B-like isoform X2 [Biomphalaria glabrata]|uniref:peptidylamidoglycolate lyase n=1 Tax=Biomphalaria glabrata TaxID=6526 RepID=A0A9W3AZ61_BIOGL|nr:peptidyl-glycine alpha-amidating monooxygenase B-like isoform X2 [Biomphalaria glabrata]